MTEEEVDKELDEFANEPLPDDFFPEAPKDGKLEYLIDILPPEKQEALRQRNKQLQDE